MTLTGTPFLVLLLVLTVAAIAAVVVFWGGLAGSGWPRLVARIGAVIGSNLLVLLVAAVILNDQYEFYVDWGDLFSSSPPVQQHQFAGGTSKDAVATGVSPADRPSYKASPLPAGVVGGIPFWLSVAGVRSGVTARVLVVLPDTYFSSGFSGRYYPVIEAFHGYPGSPRSWTDSVLDLPGQVRHLVLAHEMRESIIIVPEILLPNGYDGECVNLPNSAQIETWIAVDVPAWVDATFRAVPARDSWATIGFSMGAYCSALAAIKHPDVFSAGIAIAGYYRPLFPPGPYAGDAALVAANDLVAAVRNNPPPIALWISTSARDKLSYQSTESLLAGTRAPTSVTSITQKRVGHRVTAWVPLVSDSLIWLGRNVSGFAPIN